MKFLKVRFPIILTLLYVAAVLVCIPLAFDFKGAIDTTWTLVLIVLTLPWSIVSIFFAWSLIHGAGLGFLTFMYLAFACINAFILHYLCAAFQRYYENRVATDETAGIGERLKP